MWFSRKSYRLPVVCAMAALLYALEPLSGAFAATQLHYDFSDGSGTTVTDLSGQGNHGTLDSFSNTTAGQGAYNATGGWVTGGGISFVKEDADQSFVSSPLALNSLAGDFTLEFKGSYDSSSTFAPAIASTSTNTFSDWTFLGVSIDKKSIEYRAPAPFSDNAAASGGLEGQPWAKSGPVSTTNHHLALTYNATTGTLESFVDGVSQGTQTSGFTLLPAIASDATVFRVGGSGAGVFQQWSGIISGTAISTSVLSPSTFAITNGSQASTQLLYDYSDNGGLTVTDLSGNGNHGTLTEFQDTSADAGVFNGDEGWVTGGGISFADDFIPSHVETPVQVNSLLGDFTIEMTANYAAPAGASALLGSSHNPFEPGETVFFGQSPTGDGINFLAPDTGDVAVIDSLPWTDLTEPPDIEEVHHVAMVFDKATGLAEVFVDGNSIGTLDRTVSDMAGATSSFIFGRTGWSGGEQWDGVLYGAAISDTKLDPSAFVIDQFVGTPGDFDGDGDVDGNDFLVWQRDPTGKSLTDWQNNYGAGALAASTSAVPEPSTLSLLMLASVSLYGIRSRRG